MHPILRTLLLLAVVVAASCTPQRQMVYMQDKQELGDELPARPETYRLKPGDILHVQVMSSDVEATPAFNIDDVRRFTTSQDAIGDPSMYLYGYTIDEAGKIHLPVIGTLEVKGLSVDEAHARIQEAANEYLVDATVSVKIVNFSVTVLGEVRRPGSFYVYDHEFTIMDALGLAGDLTDYGNREIRVIRQTDDGFHFSTLDITDRAAVTSELYYLQPNDLVYVEPSITKRFGFAQFPFSVVFSGISTALLLINFLD